MRWFICVVIIVHGLIHTLGFVKAFGLASVPQLTKEISRPMGILWLLASLLFFTTVLLFWRDEGYWWIFGLVAVLLSQSLILLYWQDAKFGTIANIILLVPVLIAAADELPWSYRHRFEEQVAIGLARRVPQELLTEKDMAHLPVPVQKYLRYTGAVGREKVQNIRVLCRGRIKPRPDAEFFRLQSVQYNFFDQPTRLFFLRSKMFGAPFDALHLYIGANATMEVKIASLFPVVYAAGDKMDVSETVTMFNDMCLLAPATLINKNIVWRTIDSLTAEATFTNQKNTISAKLLFNQKGELIDFSSPDRYESADGKEYRNFVWSTPVRNYREFDGRRVPTYAEAIWHKPAGEFCYAQFEIVQIDYNVDKLIPIK